MSESKGLSAQGGCLIAWLILLLIVLGLGSMAYFFVGVVMGWEGLSQQGGVAVLLSLAFSVGAAGAASLLARKRFGFGMLVAAFVFASLLQLLVAMNIWIALAGMINLGVIWWLLRPVWDKLD
jgi:hypothetical protein